MEFLINFDHELFTRINHEWSNAFFDWLMPAITDLHRDPRFLAALLPLLAFWIWKKRGFAVRAILVMVLAIGLSDFTSYRVVKSAVERQRPMEAGLQVDLRTHRHSGTSFPSNHSANIFAAATSLTFVFPGWAPLFFLIAAAVGYSRIYVGVHFPLDVLGGAILGVTIATVFWLSLGQWVRTGKAKWRARKTDPS